MMITGSRGKRSFTLSRSWSPDSPGITRTAAATVMQGELLLISRDEAAIRHYLPNLERACGFMETRRDPENGLFLAGPAANLTGPGGFCGFLQPDGTYAVKADLWDDRVENELGKGFGRLKQFYGIHRATMEARRKGLTVRRLALPDGAIRLALCRV